jgi:hypothetical protein
MDANPEFAEKFTKVLQGLSYFNTEKEALTSAIKRMQKDGSNYQIWAKIEKGSDGIIRVKNWWLVTDDARVQQAADYIGMALMYDSSRILNVMDNEIPIDDVVAYY